MFSLLLSRLLNKFCSDIIVVDLAGKKSIQIHNIIGYIINSNDLLTPTLSVLDIVYAVGIAAARPYYSLFFNGT